MPGSLFKRRGRAARPVPWTRNQLFSDVLDYAWIVRYGQLSDLLGDFSTFCLRSQHFWHYHRGSRKFQYILSQPSACLSVNTNRHEDCKTNLSSKFRSESHPRAWLEHAEQGHGNDWIAWSVGGALLGCFWRRHPILPVRHKFTLRQPGLHGTHYNWHLYSWVTMCLAQDIMLDIMCKRRGWYSITVYVCQIVRFFSRFRRPSWV